MYFIPFFLCVLLMNYNVGRNLAKLCSQPFDKPFQNSYGIKLYCLVYKFFVFDFAGGTMNINDKYSPITKYLDKFHLNVNQIRKHIKRANSKETCTTTELLCIHQGKANKIMQ